jgi:hypothetical protein
MGDPAKASAKKPTPPWMGLAASADLWLFGALLLWAPSYLSVDGVLATILYVVGFALLILSLAGALTELGKLWHSEGLNYWGVSLVFLVPAVLVILADESHRIPSTLTAAARISILGLLAVGGGMFFQGIPYFFWSQSADTQAAAAGASSEVRGSDPGGSRVNRKAAANAIVALLALVTAVVTLVEKILR